MAVPGEVESLRSLQRDLVDFSESRLANIDRLLFDLEAHVQAFRDLLEKPAKNEKNREALGKGVFPISWFLAITNGRYTKITWRNRHRRIQRFRIFPQCRLSK